MKRFVKIIIISVAVFIFTIIVFGAGVALGDSGLGPDVGQAAADQPPQFQVFWQAWGIVHQYFVDRNALDPTVLTYGAIRGMVDALGDQGHTTFLTPKEVASQQSYISGKFSGIGAQLGVKNGLPTIVAPFDGSPADQAGIKAGDIIIRVDSQDVTTLPLNQVVNLIRGPQGTQVTLTVLRPDESKRLDITITRGEIDVPAATWAMVPGTQIALIRLSQFSANADKDMTAAIEEAKTAGATGLIVDVRNDPGGLLDQAIKVTSQFVKDGNVLLEEDANGNRKAFPVDTGGLAPDIPMVVLINQGSASASEIFAGAIQDHHRGSVVAVVLECTHSE